MTQFNKPPGWGSRFQFPENQQINFDGLQMSVTDKIIAQMVDNYDDVIAAEIARAARAAGASDVTVLNKAAIVDALMKRTPKKPIHFQEVRPRHEWMRKDNGEIDLFAAESGFHNGPMCRRCYTSKCVHCDPDWDNDEECILDEMKCPGCQADISRGTKYCQHCGQAIDWEER